MAKAKAKPKTSRKKSSFARKGGKSNFLAKAAGSLPTKGNVKNTLLETGKDLIIGVLGGGLIGAAIGKPSLLIGLGVTGLGHFTDQRLATLLGMGIMAANGFQNAGLSGLDGFSLAEMKTRMNAYKKTFATKLYLDKALRKQTAALPVAATNGFGNLTYFNFPGDLSGGSYDKDLVALERIERQIEESGRNHAKRTGMSGDFMEGMEGMEGTDGFGAADSFEGTDGLDDVADMNL